MSTKNKKVLVVEDEQPIAKALELKLSKSGFAVQLAFDGQEALKMLDQEKFDLVLLDLIVPKVDGFAILAQINKKNIKVPVIVTSNLGQEEAIKRAKSLGAIGYLVKSDTPIKDIVDKINSIIK